MAFRFINTAPLIDHELELVAPETKWVDALLKTCADPRSGSDPAATSMTRLRAMDIIRAAPGGRNPGDAARGHVPYYYFWMRLRNADAPVEIAGSVSLRIGDTDDLRLYVGNIGYNVFPPARGHHYAQRASQLVLEIARAHGMRELWITCNPDNWASRRTCEGLGCELIDIVAVPVAHPLFERGDREKCRYLLKL
jgi:tagatose 1,6-diphosphate aldolase